MKTFILIVGLLVSLIAGGCGQAKREAMILRFQNAYPETWEQKLLEYDIQRERYRRNSSYQYNPNQSDDELFRMQQQQHMWDMEWMQHQQEFRWIQDPL